jgi:hypothetical protein
MLLKASIDLLDVGGAAGQCLIWWPDGHRYRSPAGDGNGVRGRETGCEYVMPKSWEALVAPTTVPRRAAVEVRPQRWAIWPTEGLVAAYGAADPVTL